MLESDPHAFDVRLIDLNLRSPVLNHHFGLVKLDLSELNRSMIIFILFFTIT